MGCKWQGQTEKEWTQEAFQGAGERGLGDSHQPAAQACLWVVQDTDARHSQKTAAPSSLYAAVGFGRMLSGFHEVKPLALPGSSSVMLSFARKQGREEVKNRDIKCQSLC